MQQKYPAHNMTEWHQIMADYAASGLTQKAFCQRAGLAISTFSKWRKQLGLVGTEPRAVTASHADFRPLQLTSRVDEAVAIPACGASHADWDVELVLGRGITLRLRTVA